MLVVPADAAADRPGGQMGAVRKVLAIPEMRRLQAAWFGGVSASYGALVAASVYAFALGGARAVALFGVLRIVPALVLTPVVTSVADRLPRERLLLWTVLLRSAALVLATAAILTGQSLLVVLLLAGGESALLGVHRPAHNALLLWLARTPEELTAANVVTSILEGTAVFAGPVLVGVALAVSGPGAGMAVAAALMLGGAAALAGLRVGGQQAGDRTAGNPVRQIVEDLVDGVRAYPATPGTPTLLAIIFVQAVVRGLLTVLIVVLAVDVLGIGEPGVGWLNAAIGFGGLVGGVLAVRVVRDRWLARWAALAVAGWGLPLIVFIAVDATPAAFVLLALVGVANAVMDVASFTALQRSLPPAAIGRALGVVETVAFLGMGLGAALAPVALIATDVRGVLVASGVVLVVAAAAAWPAVTVIDRGVPLPGPEVSLLRRLPIFAPLPLVTVQYLATRLQEARYEDGAVVIREGEPGDVFHVIAEGEAVASVAGRPVRTMEPGDGFGEIALLRNVPRTATVTARGPLRTATLHRADFLAALAVNLDSAAAADALASGRLGTEAGPGPAQ